MDMEDCKEMIELRPISTPSNNHLHVHSSEGVAPRSVPSVSMAAHTSLSASYLHARQLLQSHQQQHQNSHQQPPSCSPLLHPQNPHQLPPAHHQFNHPLRHLHDRDGSDMLIPRTGAENHTYANDTSAQGTHMDGILPLLHPTGGEDVGLLNPVIHTPKATRATSSEQTLGTNAAMDRPENLGIIVKPSICEASTTTPPQPSGTQHVTHIPMGSPLPDLFKKKRGRARKGSADAPSSIDLSTATRIGHHFGERGQMGASVKGLMPCVIAIARGEDVSIRITSFQLEGNWGICVLSALGSISNVTLRHSEASDGTITYECEFCLQGCYDILSLSGSLAPICNEGFQDRGGLIVSLAGLDGRVIGGEVTGIFVAASPIKVVVGTFISEADSSEKQGGSVPNNSQAEMTTGSPSCVTIPVQSSIYC